MSSDDDGETRSDPTTVASSRNGSGPRISVVIPTHNRADLVGRAVSSVLAQTVPPDEVLVVDDASTDNTLSRLEVFGDRIMVIRADRNIERGAARNLGVQRSTGDLVAFLDSDDEWAATKLELQLPSMTEEAGACVTGLRYIDGDGAETGSTYLPPADAVERLPVYNPLLGAPSSLVVRRDQHAAVGGFPEGFDLQGSEDWIYLNRLRARGVVFHLVQEPLVRYRIHPTNSTADPRSLARSMWAAVDQMEGSALISTAAADQARALTAGAIARAFASSRDLSATVSWWLETLRFGGAWPALRLIGGCLRAFARGGRAMAAPAAFSRHGARPRRFRR